ncbi:MAG: hypothetical protein IK093_10660 [Ruminiclostridium sp.]|nr:hypothetical protein [Ruminiclostridium sp.]
MKKNELKKLGITIKNNWRIAVVVTVMLAISGYLLSSYGMTKHYITTAKVMVESTDDVPHTEKTATAALLFTSPKMYDAINDNLVTKFSYAELAKMINVVQESGTQIITATFDCETSSDSYKLAELYLSQLRPVIDEYEANLRATVISSPVEPQRPDFPDERLFTIVGASIGAALSILGIIIIWKLDNTVTSADNITEEYGVPVIGELMDFDNEIDYLGR